MKAVRCETIFTSFRSRSDGSLGASLVTPELSVPEKIAFMELQGVVTETLVYPKDSKDSEVIEVRKDMEGKSPASRLRACLFRLWKLAEDYKAGVSGLPFETFYSTQMEKFIEEVKRKIEAAKG